MTQSLAFLEGLPCAIDRVGAAPSGDRDVIPLYSLATDVPLPHSHNANQGLRIARYVAVRFGLHGRKGTTTTALWLCLWLCLTHRGEFVSNVCISTTYLSARLAILMLVARRCSRKHAMFFFLKNAMHRSAYQAMFQLRVTTAHCWRLFGTPRRRARYCEPKGIYRCCTLKRKNMRVFCGFA